MDHRGAGLCVSLGRRPLFSHQLMRLPAHSKRCASPCVITQCTQLFGWDFTCIGAFINSHRLISDSSHRFQSSFLSCPSFLIPPFQRYGSESNYPIYMQNDASDAFVTAVPGGAETRDGDGQESRAEREMDGGRSESMEQGRRGGG